MSDPKTPAGDNKPVEDQPLHVAKKGVKDTDHIVTGALGEPIPGAVADTTDGDL
jgi:hypothetical protein